MARKERIPKRALEDKNFPYYKHAKDQNPKAYRKYLRQKRWEPIVEKWSKAKPIMKWAFAILTGVIGTLLAQWVARLLGWS